MQTHLTTSTFNVLCHFSGIKKPAQWRVLVKFMRLVRLAIQLCEAVPELKQFVAHFAMIF
ncbi:hypothetical protein ACSGCB_004441 [Shigella flexneri]